jgi:hypothetical protein
LRQEQQQQLRKRARADAVKKSHVRGDMADVRLVKKHRAPAPGTAQTINRGGCSGPASFRL